MNRLQLNYKIMVTLTQFGDFQELQEQEDIEIYQNVINRYNRPATLKILAILEGDLQDYTSILEDYKHNDKWYKIPYDKIKTVVTQLEEKYK